MAEIRTDLTPDERASRKFVLPVFGQSPTGEPDHYEIPFTQYLLPNGRQEPNDWICASKEVAEKAQDILNAGFRFDIEVLRTGQVSATIGGQKDYGDGDPEDTDCAMALCFNNEQVPIKIGAMIMGFKNFESGVHRG